MRKNKPYFIPEGATRAQTGLQGKPIASIVNKLYGYLFQRQPDPEGFVYYYGMLQSDCSMDKIIEKFCRSDEYLNVHGGFSNGGFEKKELPDCNEIFQDLKSRPNILLTSNCSTVGLERCLSLLCRDIDITSVSIHQWQENITDYCNKLMSYDIVLCFEHCFNLLPKPFCDFPNIFVFPSLYSSLWHPDLTYIDRENTPISGPVGPYHSRLCITGFLLGFSEQEVKNLFSENVFALAGFFSSYAFDKKQLLEMFSNFGINLNQSFTRWMQKGIFPHSVNHFNIEMTRDVAADIAEAAGLNVTPTPVLPPDNLLVGPVFPIYPAIADRLGIASGSYDFKTDERYHIIGLDEFVALSFEVYKNTDLSNIQFNSFTPEQTLKIQKYKI